MGKTKGLVIVISGPSGVGKTTLCKKLQEVSPELKYSVSVTTRPIRKNEEDGRDYFFVTQKKFKKMVNEKEFIEWAVVHNYYYGTPRKFVDEMVSKEKNIILGIDVQGARQIKKIYHNNSVLVFVLPPSWETLKNRLYARGEDNKETIRVRLKNARKELKYITDYEYLIINDNVEGAVVRIQSIINKENRKRMVSI